MTADSDPRAQRTRSTGDVSHPRVSVIIPAFNAERFIRDAVMSALAQTEGSLEIIVVDDASTDATVAVVESMHDPRIRVIRAEVNRGVSAARNLALRAASGDWVAFLDADDWWERPRLERLIRTAELANADLVADDCQLFEDGARRPWSTLFRLRRFRIARPRAIEASEFVRIDLGLVHPIVRRRFLVDHDIGFDETLRVTEDFAFDVTCLLAGATFVVVPEAHYAYRARRGALTNDRIAVLRSLGTVARSLGESASSSSDPALQGELLRLERRVTRESRYYELVSHLKARDAVAALRVLASSPSVAITAATRAPVVLRARGSRRHESPRLLSGHHAPRRSPAVGPREGPPRTAPLRILVVAPYLPVPPDVGFSIRVFHLLEEMAARSEVTLLAYGRPRESWKIQELEAIGVRTRVVEPPPSAFAPDLVAERGARERLGYVVSQAIHTIRPSSYQGTYLITGELRRALRDLAGSTQFDVVQFEGSELGGLVEDARRGGARVVLDEHNIEYTLRLRLARTQSSRIRAANNWLEARKFERHERRTWSRIDGCLAVSQQDAAVIRSAQPALPVAVIPNGVDLDRSAAHDAAPGAPTTSGDVPVDEESRLVFVGRLDYRPNSDGVLWFAHEVLPLIRQRHHARLVVVGPNPPRELRALAGDGVDVTGRVDDVRPLLEAATVVPVPLRSGGGTRLKILEALALERPVVSTRIGAEGLDVIDGEHLLIADDPGAMAGAITRLIDDRDLAATLGRQGRALVERAYGWPSIGARLDAFLREIVDSDSGAGPDGTVSQRTERDA